MKRCSGILTASSRSSLRPTARIDAGRLVWTCDSVQISRRRERTNGSTKVVEPFFEAHVYKNHRAGDRTRTGDVQLAKRRENNGSVALRAKNQRCTATLLQYALTTWRVFKPQP